MRASPLFVALALLAGCATGYHAESIGGGYSDTQIDRNKFRVTFKGSIGSKQKETDEQALLRAAEVARQNGFPFFVTSGSAPVGSAVSLATNTVGSPASTLTITCFREAPDTTAVVYNVDRVIETLGPKYGRP